MITFLVSISLLVCFFAFIFVKANEPEKIHYSNQNIVIKSSFQSELEREYLKYGDLNFEKSKNKIKTYGIQAFELINFVDEKGLMILNVSDYITIEFNSIEDYFYEKERLKIQYKNYKNALIEYNKYYPPEKLSNNECCFYDDYEY